MGEFAIFFRIFRFYFAFPILLAVALVLFYQLNRMQSIYQKSLVRKVKKIKARKNEYVNEKDKEKLPKLEKNHAKAVKRLETRFKRVMLFNRDIIISNPILIDNENLALPHQTPFTFNDKSKELIKQFNEKHLRRQKTINSESKKTKEVKPRGLSLNEMESLEPKKDLSKKPKTETKGKVDVYKDIYKDEEDLFKK